MVGLIWGGVVVAMLGVAGLLACGVSAMRARSLEAAAARAVLQKVMVWNLAAMGVAMFGLMAVVVGLILR